MYKIGLEKYFFVAFIITSINSFAQEKETHKHDEESEVSSLKKDLVFEEIGKKGINQTWILHDSIFFSKAYNNPANSVDFKQTIDLKSKKLDKVGDSAIFKLPETIFKLTDRTCKKNGYGKMWFEGTGTLNYLKHSFLNIKKYRIEEQYSITTFDTLKFDYTINTFYWVQDDDIVLEFSVKTVSFLRTFFTFCEWKFDVIKNKNALEVLEKLKESNQEIASSNAITTNQLNLTKLNVFPNPARDFVTIDFTAPKKIKQILVYNENGQLVKTVEKEFDANKANKYTLDLSNNLTGTYWVTLNTRDNQKITKKLTLIK